jgi:hypothetical protein
MNWEMITSLSSLVAAIALIFSLLYVGRQVRDSSRQIKVNTSSNIAANAQDGWLPIYNSPEHARIWRNGLEQISDLTADEHGVFLMLFDRQFFNYETTIVAFEEGAYDSELFESYSGLMRMLLRSAGGQWWLANEGRLPITARARKYLEID